MAGLYKKFLVLCKEWPIDKKRTGKSLAEVIHKNVLNAFRSPQRLDTLAQVTFFFAAAAMMMMMI